MSTVAASAFKMAVAPSAEMQGRSDRARLEEVAEQFEALFVKSILSSARSAQLSDPLLNNEGAETFTAMLDQEYAAALSHSSPLGIAEALIRQVEHRVPNGDD